MITLQGVGVARAALSVGWSGPPVVDCDLVSDDAVEPDDAGRVVLRVDAGGGVVELVGTLDPRGGSFGGTRRVRVVGGAGGWVKSIPAKPYHSDAGVQSRLVVEDAARVAGETLADLPDLGRLGVSYARTAGPASGALIDVVGEGWRVDFDGKTRLGLRPSVEADPEQYTILDYDPRDQRASLNVERIDAVLPGSLIKSTTAGPFVVRSLELEISGAAIVATAWVGAGGVSRLGEAMRRVVDGSTPRRFFGAYKYRVYSMATDGRVNLQIVRKAAGMPDLLPVEQWQAPGVHAELTPGVEVAVMFLDGLLTDPIVMGAAGKTHAGHVPAALSLGGGETPVALLGSVVNVFLPPGSAIAGLLSGAPFTGVITPTGPLVGVITTGATKVRGQ